MAQRSASAPDGTGEAERPSLRPSPAVTSNPRPAWRRPRFAAGVVLIAAAVALGSWAVERAGRGTPAWVAAHDLAPGDVVAVDDLRAVTLHWEGDPGVYPGTEDSLVGAVVVSFVGSGELVPASALGQAQDLDGRPVAVPLTVGSHITAGTVVDLWSVATGSGVDPRAAAELLAEGVTVLGVEEDDGLLRTGSGEVARVLVPQEVVPLVLAAQANDATLTLVEHPGG